MSVETIAEMLEDTTLPVGDLAEAIITHFEEGNLTYEAAFDLIKEHAPLWIIELNAAQDLIDFEKEVA